MDAHSASRPYIVVFGLGAPKGVRLRASVPVRAAVCNLWRCLRPGVYWFVGCTDSRSWTSMC